MLAAFLLAVLLPQVDWIDTGRRYVKAWNAGKVNLQAPVALDRPGFLDPRNAKIVELVKARGDKFHWTAEAELSFICSGLAAAVGDDGADVLWQLGLVRIGNDAVAELRNRAAAKRQPWLVRHTVLATIAKGRGTRYAARAVDVLHVARRGHAEQQRQRGQHHEQLDDGEAAGFLSSHHGLTIASTARR